VAQAKEHVRSETEELWDAYLAIQLTPEKKAALHTEAERRCERARDEGVYQRALEIAGKVKWSVSWQDLRLEEW
jgi:hypothetical protein